MSSDNLHRRVGELEAKVAFLLEHLGLTYEPEPEELLPPEVIELAQRGQTVQAIQVLREHTNMSLKEAKDLVDEVMRRYQGGPS